MAQANQKQQQQWQAEFEKRQQKFVEEQVQRIVSAQLGPLQASIDRLLLAKEEWAQEKADLQKERDALHQRIAELENRPTSAGPTPAQASTRTAAQVAAAAATRTANPRLQPKSQLARRKEQLARAKTTEELEAAMFRLPPTAEQLANRKECTAVEVITVSMSLGEAAKANPFTNIRNYLRQIKCPNPLEMSILGQSCRQVELFVRDHEVEAVKTALTDNRNINVLEGFDPLAVPAHLRGIVTAEQIKQQFIKRRARALRSNRWPLFRDAVARNGTRDQRSIEEAIWKEAGTSAGMPAYLRRAGQPSSSGETGNAPGDAMMEDGECSDGVTQQ